MVKRRRNHGMIPVHHTVAEDMVPHSWPLCSDLVPPGADEDEVVVPNYLAWGGRWRVLKWVLEGLRLRSDRELEDATEDFRGKLVYWREHVSVGVESGLKDTKGRVDRFGLPRLMRLQCVIGHGKTGQEPHRSCGGADGGMQVK